MRDMMLPPEAGTGPLPPALDYAVAQLDRSPMAAAEAFAAAAVSGAPGWRGLAHLGRALCLQLIGDTGAAADEVVRALALWRAAGPEAALALAGLGRALTDAGQGSPASVYLQVARRVADGAGDDIIGAVLVEEGRSAAVRGDLARAGELWAEAATSGGVTGAAASANLGRVAALGGDVEAAETHFVAALAVPGGTHRRVVADGLVALSAQAGAAGHWDEADALLRRALPLRHADHEPGALAGVLHDLGVVAQQLDRPEQSFRWFEDCRLTAEAAGDRGLEGAALRGLAEVSLSGDRPVVALAYAQQAGLVASSRGDRTAAAALLRRVGDRARSDGSAALSAEAYRAAAELLAEAGG